MSILIITFFYLFFILCLITIFVNCFFKVSTILFTRLFFIATQLIEPSVLAIKLSGELVDISYFFVLVTFCHCRNLSCITSVLQSLQHAPRLIGSALCPYPVKVLPHTTHLFLFIFDNLPTIFIKGNR